MADENDEVKSPLSFAQRLQAQAGESQRILDEHRRRLMGLISSRQQMPFDPRLMSLAAGLLAPTKTGSFSESLGYGLRGYSEEAERQLKREQEDAKMMYELEAQAQQAKQDLLGQQMFTEFLSRRTPGLAPKKEVLPTAMPEEGAAAPAIEAAPVSEAVEVPAPQPKVELAAAQPVQKPKVAAPTKQQQYETQISNLISELSSQGSDALADLTPDDIAQFQIMMPKYAPIIKSYKEAVDKGQQLNVSKLNAFKELLKVELDRQKQESEPIERDIPGVGTIKISKQFARDYDSALVKTNETGDINHLMKVIKENQYYPKFKVGEDGKPRFMTKSEIELENKKLELAMTQTPVKRQIPELGEDIYEILPVQYNDYVEAKKKGKNALQLWFNQSQLFGDVKVPGSTIGKLGTPGIEGEGKDKDEQPQARIVGETERVARQAGATKTAEKRAEVNVDQEQMILAKGDAARERILLAQDLEKFARDKSKSKIMALLERATPDSALGKLIADGVSVGSFRVGIPQLREVLLQLKKDATDTDVANLQQLGNIYTRLMFSEGSLFKGEGAVSDYERKMQERMGGTVQDTPLVAQARAQYVKTRANFDKAVADDYFKWMEKNPNGTFQKYKRDSASKYESIEAAYMNRIRKIGDTFFPDMSTGRSSAPTPSERPSRSGNAPSGNVGRFMQ